MVTNLIVGVYIPIIRIPYQRWDFPIPKDQGIDGPWPPFVEKVTMSPSIWGVRCPREQQDTVNWNILATCPNYVTWNCFFDAWKKEQTYSPGGLMVTCHGTKYKVLYKSKLGNGKFLIYSLALGQITICHQPRFPWNSRGPIPKTLRYLFWGPQNSIGPSCAPSWQQRRPHTNTTSGVEGAMDWEG